MKSDVPQCLEVCLSQKCSLKFFDSGIFFPTSLAKFSFGLYSEKKKIYASEFIYCDF